MKNKHFNEVLINELKEKLGYSGQTQNVTVQTNVSFGMTAMFGALAAFAMKYYNLSLEENGLLLIQRSVWTNKLLEDKVEFIPNEEIDSISLKGGVLQSKLIVKNHDGKKLIFKINKMMRMDWHKQTLKNLGEIYG